jgi:hypothetical protein
MPLTQRVACCPGNRTDEEVLKEMDRWDTALAKLLYVGLHASLTWPREKRCKESDQGKAPAGMEKGYINPVKPSTCSSIHRHHQVGKPHDTLAGNLRRNPYLYVTLKILYAAPKLPRQVPETFDWPPRR